MDEHEREYGNQIATLSESLEEEKTMKEYL
jgi:hypothetical protein